MKTRRLLERSLKVFLVSFMLFMVQAPGRATPQSKNAGDMMADELFAAYQTAGDAILAQAFPTNARFEAFRADFHKRVLTAWEQAPHKPAHAVFMLDVAVVALGRGYLYWADFIKQASVYVRSRSEPPGMNPTWDAFEVQWHKAAVALLSGRRRPDLVMDEGVRPLTRRMAPVPSDLGALVLVDPWILLARGFAEEGFAIERLSTQIQVIGKPGSQADGVNKMLPPRNVDEDKRSEAALVHYRQSLAFPSTRPEATVRAASVLIRLQRADEAVTLLRAFDATSTSDGVILYWRHLLLGRALEAVGQLDEAMGAYEDALIIVPSAQSPRTAMMALDLKRGRHEESQAMAAGIRTAPDPVIDPWWSYAHGDFRFFASRLKMLKTMVVK